MPEQLLQLVRQHLVDHRQLGGGSYNRVRTAEVIFEGGLKTKEKFAVARLGVVEVHIGDQATVLLLFYALLHVRIF